MTRYPLLFGYRDTLQGKGFVAGVVCDGRALLLDEGAEFWMLGVNPGGLAAPGVEFADATRSFRETYRRILNEIAADAVDFSDFRRQIEGFFADVNESVALEWNEAVLDVRAGRVTADWLQKRTGEPKLGVQVVEITASAPAVTTSNLMASARQPDPRYNDDRQEELAATPVAA